MFMVVQKHVHRNLLSRLSVRPRDSTVRPPDVRPPDGPPVRPFFRSPVRHSACIMAVVHVLWQQSMYHGHSKNYCHRTLIMAIQYNRVIVHVRWRKYMNYGHSTYTMARIHAKDRVRETMSFVFVCRTLSRNSLLGQKRSTLEASELYYCWGRDACAFERLSSNELVKCRDGLTGPCSSTPTRRGRVPPPPRSGAVFDTG